MAGDSFRLPSPSVAPTSSPFSDGTHSSIYNPPLSSSSASSPSPSNPSERLLQRLSSNIETLISHDACDTFSDVVICVLGQPVHLHRCILAARSPFFKSLLSKTSLELSAYAAKRGEAKDDPPGLRLDLGKILDRSLGSNTITRVGLDAFMLTMSFLYSGKHTVPTIRCLDNDCAHETCRPAIEFAVEVLSLASILDIRDLKSLWQNHLHDIMEKVHVEEAILILLAADVHGNDSLLSLSIQSIAASPADRIDLLKRLPLPLAEEILSLRIKTGRVNPETVNPSHEKACQRIWKALDSDDVELVQLLLKEGQLDLDSCYALHYAAAYCVPNTVLDLLEHGLANPNLRNSRGFTVLHVAAIRREPSILAYLLFKGANPLDLTPDGRTAFQLCMRSIGRSNHQNETEPGEEQQKDRLSVEILDQAGRENPFANAVFPPAVDEKELFMRLLYLENRVAMARLLFPQEAKLLTGIVHLEATSEFIGHSPAGIQGRNKGEGVDLNRMPTSHAETPIPKMNDDLIKRAQTLQKVVEIGKRIFPRCTTVLNNFMDDDVCELSLVPMGNPEEERTKKRRFCELKEILEDAFKKDVAAMERHRGEKPESSKVSASYLSTRHRK